MRLRPTILVLAFACALLFAPFGDGSSAKAPAPLLAFSADSDGLAHVFVVASTGGRPRALTSGPSTEKNPVWSPDGRTLLYTSNRTGSVDVWGVRPDGSSRRRLTSADDDDREPAWSPDGRGIVYSSYRHTDFNLWSMLPDGSRKQRLTTDRSNDVEPQLSPDGRTIVYVRTCSAAETCWPAAKDDGEGELYSAPTFGGRQRRILHTPRVAESRPRWSPDSRWIAYVAGAGRNSSVYVVRRDGSSRKRLGAGRDAEWSPDGRRIAFVSVRDGNYEISVVNADGSRLRNLTRNGAADTTPRWSPDGRRIFFVSDRGRATGIWSMNADGSDVKLVSRAAAIYDELAVQPSR